MARALVTVVVATSLLATAAAAKPKPSPLVGPVASAAADVVKRKLPPAATVVAVVAMNKADPAFAPVFERALRNVGFAVAADLQADGQAALIRYDVVPVREGVVLGLEFAGERTTRLLRPTESGSMAVVGPVIVKEDD